ncbi:Crp/Fnr family transcriptional regulator [Micromonospora sp. NPDC049301]|uniref:Crp/Fnr family transcriptional regulator n=1 Tax=Micromonospora sp. NPDC049301 TaxID=3155723 RepID=UPI0034356818
MTPLTSIPALRTLPGAAIDDIVRHSQPLRLSAGSVARHHGEPATGVVLLLAGTMVAAHTSRAGAEVWPQRWQAPALVDKVAVLAGGPAPTRLIAATSVVAMLLPRQPFLRLIDKHEVMRNHVLAALAHDVQTAQTRLTQATTLSGVARVAALLDALSRGGAGEWRGSQDDLARTLGLSRVTVNRALARLVRVGAVRVTTHRVVVTNRLLLRTNAADL